VLANAGLFGQVLRVGPWTSEVILVTDPEHAVPVQDERSGLRTLAVGAGVTNVLQLPYLPINSDLKKGDLLLTSGLGGVFPAGYPVARVTEVSRDPGEALAQVTAEPVAGVDRDREVSLVWFRTGHPASPADLAPPASRGAGVMLTPQTAPPKPATPTAPPAATAPPEEPQE